MPRLPYSVRRSGRYFARIKVPVGLQKTFGKKELRRSLRTCEYAVAAQRLPTVLAELRCEFDRLRRAQVDHVGGHGGVTLLSEAVEAFKADRRPRWSQKMIIETDYVLGIVLEVLGDRPLVEIQRSDLRAYRDLVRRLPPNFRKRKEMRGKTLKQIAEIAEAACMPTVSRGTLNRYVGHAHSLFHWLENEQIVAKNLAKGLSVAKTEGHSESEDRDRFPREKKRRPYETRELKQLFTLPPWSERNWAHPFYWSVLLSLFNGLRQAEALQLRREDVIVLDEILCLNITDAGAGQRLKNRASIRIIPVHSFLLELEFKKHMTSLGVGDLVIPNVQRDERGRFDLFAKKYGQFLRRNHLSDLTYHGLRYRFRDALREAEVPLDLSKRLGGWSVFGVSESYGSNNPVKVMDRHLARVSFGCEKTLQVPCGSV